MRFPRIDAAALCMLLSTSPLAAQGLDLLGVNTAETRYAISSDSTDNLQVTATQLRQISSEQLSWEQAGKLVVPLSNAMLERDITSPKRRAAFLAQIGHESWGFTKMVEKADGWAYEGRRDLGNTHSGDGPRYKGRGLIQLTGRANYREAGKALGIDLEGNPEKAAEPGVAAKVAGWYWSKYGCNELADKGDFWTITQRINGGQNGAKDRYAYWARAKKAVGIA